MADGPSPPVETEPAGKPAFDDAERKKILPPAETEPAGKPESDDAERKESLPTVEAEPAGKPVSDDVEKKEILNSDTLQPLVESEPAGKPASGNAEKKEILNRDTVLPPEVGEPSDIVKLELSSEGTSQSKSPVADEEYDPDNPEIPEEVLQSLLSLNEEVDEPELARSSKSSEDSAESEELNWEDLYLSPERHAYVNAVKIALGEYTDEFTTFKQLVLKHETIRIGSLKFRRWARWVLKEHTRLINGLNVFLPPEIHITNSSPTEYSTELFTDFVKLIKKNYPLDYERRSAVFVRIKKLNVENKITEDKALSMIADLFQEHPELVAEFNKFE